MKRLTIVAAALAIAAGAGTPAAAQDGDFAAKTITIYIGNTAGGTYDLMGRLLARHRERDARGRAGTQECRGPIRRRDADLDRPRRREQRRPHPVAHLESAID